MKDNIEIPRILRWKQVAQIIPWSRSYTYDLMNKGKFPRTVKLLAGGCAAGWWECDIREYMTNLQEQTRGAGNE